MIPPIAEFHSYRQAYVVLPGLGMMHLKERPDVGYAVSHVYSALCGRSAPSWNFRIELWPCGRTVFVLLHYGRIHTMRMARSDAWGALRRAAVRLQRFWRRRQLRARLSSADPFRMRPFRWFAAVSCLPEDAIKQIGRAFIRQGPR